MDDYYLIEDWDQLLERMIEILHALPEPPPPSVCWLCGDAVWEYLQAKYSDLSKKQAELVGRDDPFPYYRQELHGVRILHDPMAPPKSVRLAKGPFREWIRDWHGAEVR